MKLVIFGASGQTGRLLIEEALLMGHQVTAYVRRANAISQVHPKLRVVIGRLDDNVKLKEAIAGADVGVSTLGGGSMKRRSPEFTEGIDRIVSVMEEEGVSRFIYLSSIGAGESRFFMGPVIRFIVVKMLLGIPLADHSENEERLLKSNLLWTILRPGSLTNGSKTGKIKHGSEFRKLTGNVKISRADVAAFILDQAASKKYVKKGVWLYD